LEYDAYRTDLEELNLGPRDSITLPKIDLAQQLYLLHKEKYERLRNDVTIKLKFLEENKVLIGSWGYCFICYCYRRCSDTGQNGVV
ncbi:hypothetical protein scyTo_0027304, partial [Scyliorhinus torazame]|nr:hypothetical protein [Scyliorhinus torazame]